MTLHPYPRLARLACAGLTCALGGLSVLIACSGQEARPSVTASDPATPPPEPTTQAASDAGSATEAAEPIPAQQLEESETTRIVSEVDLRTPKSIVFDPGQDVYFVSNIAGDPYAADGDGFISKVSPAGEVQARFISGGEGGVTLNAPKGMTLVEDTLVVADIDVLRLFDRRSGKPRGHLRVEGATSLEGVALGPDRRTVYVSDSGLSSDAGSSGAGAVYRVVDGKVSRLAAGKELGHPTGLWPEKGGTWVVTFGSGELFWLTNGGKRQKVQKLEQGQLDGIVRTSDGTFLISSWQASAVLGGRPPEPFLAVLSGLSSPAGIGYDTKRDRVLVPLSDKDALVLHALAE